MFDFLSFIIVPFLAAMLLMKIRPERSLVFFGSALLAAYITLVIQPWVTVQLLQVVPDADQVWCPMLALPVTCLVLLALFITVIKIVAIPNDAEKIRYPVGLSKAVSFVFIFFGMTICFGVLWLGLASQPVIDRIPVFRQQSFQHIGQIVAGQCVKTVQLGTPVTVDQRLWFNQYPVTVYVSNGGAIEALGELDDEAENSDGTPPKNKYKGFFDMLSAVRKETAQ